MALFPPNFIEDLKSHADIVQVVQERVALRRSGATWKGLCPVSRGEDAVVPRQRRQGILSLLRVRRQGRCLRVRQAARQDHVSRGRPAGGRAGRRAGPRAGGWSAGPREQARPGNAAARPRGGRHVVSRAVGSPLTERPRRRLLASRGVTPATIELLGMGYAPPSREALKTKLLARRLRRRFAGEDGTGRRARRRNADRSVSQPADDSNRPRQRDHHRVWRPRHGRRARFRST